MVPVPRRQLGHDDPDHEQAHCRFDVGAVRDGEPPVGAGKEQVEPQGGRDRGHQPGKAVAGDGHGHDHGDEDKSGGRVSKAGPERDQDGGHPKRQDKCRGEGDGISVTPEAVHSNLVSIGGASFSPFGLVVLEVVPESHL